MESFEGVVDLAGIGGAPMPAVFIRAPWVEVAGPEVEVLGTVTPPGRTERHIVAVRQGALLATSFHPEMTDDLRIHRYFVRLCAEHAARVATPAVQAELGPGLSSERSASSGGETTGASGSDGAIGSGSDGVIGSGSAGSRSGGSG